MFARASRITANWHLVRECNYKCRFCYAHFADASARLPLDDSVRVLRELAHNGVYRVNFAGGEPLLHRDLPHLVRTTVELGMRASIISNGTRITRRFLESTAPYLSQLGISCDSLDERTNVAIGRGHGAHVDIVRRVFERLHAHAPHCQRKLNTVVMRANLHEDFHDFLAELDIQRWKVFKVLRIEGENEAAYDDLQITDAEFARFVARHAHCPIVPEDGDAMTGSYLMLDPDARVYQNHGGTYRTGAPVHEVGLAASVAAAGRFDQSKFVARGGAIDLR